MRWAVGRKRALLKQYAGGADNLSHLSGSYTLKIKRPVEVRQNIVFCNYWTASKIKKWKENGKVARPFVRLSTFGLRNTNF